MPGILPNDKRTGDGFTSDEGGNEAHVDHFGALRVAQFRPIVEGNFPGPTLDPNVWTQTLTATGSTSLPGDGTGILSTGTDAAGSVKLISVKPGVFHAGVITQYQSGVFAGVGVAGNTRRWGLISLDEQHGLFFELNGTAFRVVARNSGTDTIVEQASFNGDPGFSPGNSNNTYRIKYSAGRAEFYRAFQGNLILVHEMVDAQKPLSGNLDLHLYYENTNTGNTSNIDFILRGASTGLLGERIPVQELQKINIDKAFTPGESLTTDWAFVGDATQVWIIAESDTVGSGTIEWSDDGITPKRVNEDASATIANPALFDGAINVNIMEVPFGKWFRGKWTQGAVGGNLHFRATAIYGASRIPVTQVGFPYDDSDHVVPVKAAVVRQDPDGDYVNQKQGGVHPDLSTDTPLTANGVFRSPWVAAQGFVYIGATIRTDQPSKDDGASVQFAREVFDALDIENITQANPAVVTITGHGIPQNERVLITGVVGMVELNERYFFINVLDADTFELVGEDSTSHGGYISGGKAEQVRITREVIETVTVPVPGQSIDPFAGTQIQDAFVRVEYFNGAVAQGLMNLHFHIMDVTQTADLRIVASQEMEFSSAAQYAKALTYAHPDAFSKPIPVFQDATTRGQYAHIVGHDARTPISPVNSKRKTQVNVGPTPLQVLVSPLANRVSLGIRNLDDDTQLFYGHSASITPTSGSMLIDPKDLYVDEIGPGVPTWLVTGTVGVGTNTQTIEGGSTANPVAVTTPDNLLDTDADFAEFNALNSTLDVVLNDFTFTGSHVAIQNVKIKARMRKEDSPTVTAAHVATVTGTAINTPAVSTGTVTANANHKYFAAVSFTDTAQSVASISGLGLTWSFVESQTNDTRLEVWQGVGSAVSNGPVTASLSAAAGDAAIAVSRFSSVDLSTSIEATAKATGGSSTPSASVNTDAAGDIVFAAVSNNRYTNTPDAGITEQADFGTGGGPADIQLAIMTRPSLTPGSKTISSTLAGTDGWSIILVSVNKGPGTDPQMTVSYEVSGVPGATTLTQTLDTTTATEYEADITADRVWTDPDLDNTELVPTQTQYTDIRSRIEYLRLEVVEAEAGGVIRVALDESAESI